MPNEKHRPTPRGEARPEPHKTVMRAVAPRGAPELSADRAAKLLRPRGGPPRPRGVR